MACTWEANNLIKITFLFEQKLLLLFVEFFPFTFSSCYVFHITVINSSTLVRAWIITFSLSYTRSFLNFLFLYFYHYNTSLKRKKNYCKFVFWTRKRHNKKYIKTFRARFLIKCLFIVIFICDDSPSLLIFQLIIMKWK